MICPKCKKNINSVYFFGWARIEVQGKVKFEFDDLDLDALDINTHKLEYACPNCDYELTFDEIETS